MTHVSGRYVFLSRPRRFGKSLLVSTLKSYFEGKKELFEGLAIERLEKDWGKHPVIHFSLAGGKHKNKEELTAYLDFILSQQERTLGIENGKGSPNMRLAHLIEMAYRQTGQKAVVLIDEYDAPLLDVVHEDEHLNELRHVMRNFYSPLKDADPYLRFVFLTGITKFSQVSIFSELNNINNLSMLPEYAGICGITKEEIETQMRTDVEMLGKRIGKNWEETMEALANNYDGYHFSWPSPDVFNPFSLLSALTKEDACPKVILYSLNPADFDMLGTLMGPFQDDEIPGKIQLGSAWWFCDTDDGMYQQMKTLARLGLLGNFIGMLTDSRSFLSYTRHELFRRLMCNLIGSWVENGQYPNDDKALKQIVEGISYYNAKRYFDL